VSLSASHSGIDDSSFRSIRGSKGGVRVKRLCTCTHMGSSLTSKKHYCIMCVESHHTEKMRGSDAASIAFRRLLLLGPSITNFVLHAQQARSQCHGRGPYRSRSWGPSWERGSTEEMGLLYNGRIRLSFLSMVDMMVFILRTLHAQA